MHYYDQNIADYRKDTSHLSLLEHGVYRQLLDSYYLNEAPLTLDRAKLMRSHSVRTPEEILALENVLQDFFIKSEDGYRHKRCDLVIAAYKEKSAKAAAAAHARWSKESQDIVDSNNETNSVNADAMRSHSDSNANHKPITNNHKPVKTLKPKPSSSIPEGFDLFWSTYPKKINKEGSIKAWKKLNPDSEIQTKIIQALAWQVGCEQWTKDGGQFVPHASTYLNQCRWLDEPLPKNQFQPRNRGQPYESEKDRKRRETIEGLTGKRNGNGNQIIDINP